MFGDGVLRTIADEVGFQGMNHYRAMCRILDALERAPDLFTKRGTSGWDSRGRERRLRVFVLVPQGGPQPGESN